MRRGYRILRASARGNFLDLDEGEGLRADRFPLDSAGVLVYSGSGIGGRCRCGRLAVHRLWKRVSVPAGVNGLRFRWCRLMLSASQGVWCADVRAWGRLSVASSRRVPCTGLGEADGLLHTDHAGPTRDTAGQGRAAWTVLPVPERAERGPKWANDL